MTKEELFHYCNINNQFKKDCSRVCKELGKYNDEYNQLNYFYLEGDYVYGTFYDYYSFEKEENCFPKELLTFSDQELELYVNNLIKEKTNGKN